MAAVRGRQQAGRSTAFKADKPLRAATWLEPGDPARRAYEDLVVQLGVSGAEVLRRALLEMHTRKKAEGGRIADTKAA